MSAGEWCLAVYLGVAVVFAVLQWADNDRVYYAFGPPSCFWVGALWPVWVVVPFAGLAYRAIRTALRRRRHP